MNFLKLQRFGSNRLVARNVFQTNGKCFYHQHTGPAKTMLKSKRALAFGSAGLAVLAGVVAIGLTSEATYAETSNDGYPKIFTSYFSKKAGTLPSWITALTDSSAPAKTYKYVIVGCGQSAQAAIKVLLEEGVRDEILVVGADPRMNTLSHSEGDFFKKAGSNVILTKQLATSLDVDNKRIELEDGSVFGFGKIMLATGGTRSQLDHVAADCKERVVHFRSSADLNTVQDLIVGKKIKHVTVIGGGFLGTEIATFLKELGGQDVQISQVYAEPGVLYRNFPDYLRAYYTARLRSFGIEQKNFTLISSVTKCQETEGLTLETESWEKGYAKTDFVVFAPTNVKANVDLANDAGLEVDGVNGGIMVNRELMAASDVYVGGDAASYPNAILGRRREQNYDHAVTSGVVCAYNMLGNRWPYNHIPIYWSNIPAINMNNVLVGNCDSRLESVGFWDISRRKQITSGGDDNNDDPKSSMVNFSGKYNKGVVYYLEQGQVVGVLLVNISNIEKALKESREFLYDKIDYTSVVDLDKELQSKVAADEFKQPFLRRTNTKNSPHQRARVASNIFKVKRHEIQDVPSSQTGTGVPSGI